MRIAQGTWSDNYDGTVTTYAPTGAGALKSTFGYDAMGRQVRQQDWTGDGSGVAYDRQVTYDAKGRVSYETDVQKQGNDTYTSYVSNAFADGGGTAYALGAATASSNTSYKNGAYQSTASTATSYGWYDAAVQSQVDYSPGTGGTYHTWYTNSATGVLQSASVQDGRPRSISLTNDALGQALRRDEADNTASTGDPHELWYRFNGKQIGYIGNNDTDNIGYAASLQRRVTASVAGPFKNGQTYGAGIVEFDQAYDAINSYQQGAGGGSYTVRDGDSLSGIAAQLWGDAGLWYKLAQANGLSGDGGLAAGQTLSVPAGVVRSSNNAATFRPYDVSQAYGDSSPTTPSPQAAKKNKCGAFGAILLVAIAVAVTALTQGAAIGAVSPLFGHAGAVAVGSALAGVAGSAASQAVGLATGIQDTFDWKGVALAGIGAGIGGVLGSVMPGGGAIGAIERGVLGSAVTQGIGVATGLQSKFDWAGVAAAGIGAGVGQALGGKPDGLGKVGASLAANTVGGLANAATRSLVNGTDFGDNLMAALPDIIGQTVGNVLADGIASRSASRGYYNTNPDGVQQAAQIALANSSAVELYIGGGGLLAAALGSGQNAPFLDYVDNGGPPITSVAEANAWRAREMLLNGDKPGAPEKIAARYQYYLDALSGLQTSGPLASGYVTSDAPVDLSSVQSVPATTASEPESGGIFGWVSSFFSNWEWPTTRLNQAFAGQPGWDAGIRVKMAGGDSEKVTFANRQGRGNMLAQAFGNFSLGLWETNVGFTSAALAPPTILMTERSSSPYVGGGGRSGFVSSPWWGLAAGAAFAKFGAGPLVAGNEGVDLALKYKPGWSLSQQADAAAKAQILTDADTVALKTARGGTSAATRYRGAGGEIPAGSDVDHMIDLQLGGSDTLVNMWPLDSSVNRSLGAQIQRQIRNLPPGTRINRVTIGHR